MCPACTDAAKRPSHEFIAGCLGCYARTVARSPHFDRVRHAGALDRRYLALLEQFSVSHDEVKAAAAIDDAQKVRAV